MKIISFIIVISLLFSNVSCNIHSGDDEQKHEQEEKPEHDHSNEADHGHDHENIEGELPEFSRNIFGEKLELFFESSAFVAGETSKIIAHFNSLTNFKPVTNGKLTVALVNRNFNIIISANKPTRTGIFIIELKPEKRGKYRLYFSYESDTLKEKIKVKNIQVFADEQDAKHHLLEKSDPDEISYLKEQMWKTDFETQEIRLQDFSQTIKTVGEILPAQGEKRIISSKTNGMVLFSASTLVHGKPVKANEELFIISSEAVGNENINVTYEKLKNEYEQCKILHERHKKLAAENIVSSEKLNESRKEFISDSISYFNFLSNFSKKGVSVDSQISGFIQTMFVGEGQYVTTGQPLAIVSANRRMMIRADVPLQYYNSVHKISDAFFEIPFTNKTISLEQLSGKVISVSSTVQSAGKYIPVYFEVQNNGSLIEGAFIECFLKTASISNQTVIPKTALIEELGNFYVYVQTNGESFVKREVKTIATDGINISISTGLYTGERIVTKGAMQIKLASLSSGMDSHAGHSH
jgi:RND family efflux transporter MFP subunit